MTELMRKITEIDDEYAVFLLTIARDHPELYVENETVIYRDVRLRFPDIRTWNFFLRLVKVVSIPAGIDMINDYRMNCKL
jgi:hypothetical protein